MLLGAPVSIRAERWRMATRSVAGRFVNGFSRRDWVLSVVYRGSNGAGSTRDSAKHESSAHFSAECVT